MWNEPKGYHSETRYDDYDSITIVKIDTCLEWVVDTNDAPKSKKNCDPT